jgi:hypothetical protein
MINAMKMDETLPHGHVGLSGHLAAAKVFKKLPAIDGLHPAAFQVVITAVEHLARLGQFFEVPGHGILDQLVGSAAGFRYPPVYFRLQVWITEVQVHVSKIRETWFRGNVKDAQPLNARGLYQTEDCRGV